MRTNFNIDDNNITMVKGDTLAFGVKIVDQEGKLFDIDNAYFTCKRNYTDETNVFQKSLNNGITRVEAGIYRVRVAPNDTKDLEAGYYVYDFQIGANSDVFTIMRGSLEIEQDVTV